VNIIHLEDEPWDSGLAHYALTLAEAQSFHGHRVEFWGLTGSPVLRDAEARGLKTRSWTSTGAWRSLLDLRREMAEFGAEVVNAHTGAAHTLALLTAPRAAAVIRTRGDARLPKASVLTRLAASRTTVFIAANTTLQASLQAAFPSARVRLACQGISCPEEPAPLPGAPYVGMLARFDPVKGHVTLFDAAQMLKPVVAGLKILCAGDGSELERLRWQLKPLGLDGTVGLMGHVADKWSFIAGCRVGVVASAGSEAVSRAALEWMASGRPLVATRVGGLPDLIEEGVTGLLVPPGDPKALAAALKVLLLEPARAEEMGAKARERWSRHFSVEPFYQTTQDIYAEAIDSLSRRR